MVDEKVAQVSVSAFLISLDLNGWNKLPRIAAIVFFCQKHTGTVYLQINQIGFVFVTAMSF